MIFFIVYWIVDSFFFCKPHCCLCCCCYCYCRRCCCYCCCADKSNYTLIGKKKSPAKQRQSKQQPMENYGNGSQSVYHGFTIFYVLTSSPVIHPHNLRARGICNPFLVLCPWILLQQPAAQDTINHFAWRQQQRPHHSGKPHLFSSDLTLNPPLTHPTSTLFSQPLSLSSNTPTLPRQTRQMDED